MIQGHAIKTLKVRHSLFPYSIMLKHSVHKLLLTMHVRFFLENELAFCVPYFILWLSDLLSKKGQHIQRIQHHMLQIKYQY